jgi:16S rRNA (guanine966-N2)-methyltransferase
MRVISGTWRGRKLLSPKGDLVRPTADRVKEAMFSILGKDVRNSLVLDLCCGAGGLAIEALSRGAKEAVLVDISKKSLELARKNLDVCRAATGSFDLVKSDAEVFYNNWAPPAGNVPWVLLSDPPYHSSVAQSILGRLTRDAPAEGFVAAILEHGHDFPLAESDTGLWQVSSRRYGKTSLTIVRPV